MSKYEGPTYEYRVRDLDLERHEQQRLEEELNRQGKEGYLLIETAGHHAVYVRTIEPVPPPPPVKQATTGRVSVVPNPTTEGAPPMALTVDAAGVAKFQFEDDKGDLDVAPLTGDGSGIVVSFSSDNPAVVSGYDDAVQGVDANGTPQWTANPTVVADGSFNLSATVANTSGADLTDNDGTTEFVQPAAVPVTFAAGQASTGVTSES